MMNGCNDFWYMKSCCHILTYTSERAISFRGCYDFVQLMVAVDSVGGLSHAD